MIARGLKHDDDVERVSLLRVILPNDVPKNTWIDTVFGPCIVWRLPDTRFCRSICEKGKGVLPASEAKEALEALTEGVVR